MECNVRSNFPIPQKYHEGLWEVFIIFLKGITVPWHLKSFMKNVLTLQRLVFTRRSYIIKQTCSFQLQICLSMHDLLVDTRRNSVKTSVVVSTFQTKQQILERLIFFYCKTAEEYLEFCQRFKVDCFAKMVNDLKPLFPRRFILDVSQGPEYASSECTILTFGFLKILGMIIWAIKN